MKGFAYKAVLALGLAGSSAVAWACADSSCYPTWRLFGGSSSCEARGFLTPGNDTRVNLSFLLADRSGPARPIKDYPKASYYSSGYGRVFVDPYVQRAVLFNDRNLMDLDAQDTNDTVSSSRYGGTRCGSFETGSAAFAAALKANASVPVGERDSLIAARAEDETVCSGTRGDEAAGKRFTAWPAAVSAAGREFLTYAQASDAFYADDFVAARSGFSALASARDPWVRETAAYMLIRTEYAAAQKPTEGEYGDFDNAKADRSAIKRGLQANAGYLKSWPSGRYAASALGLVRRGLWLAGDYGALAREYDRMLGVVDPVNKAAGSLVFEIDNKLLFSPGAKDVTPQGTMLLAVQDLYAMRMFDGEESGPANGVGLSAAQLAAQAPAFSDQPELYSFLQATHAFYIAKDPRKVLALVPDAAKQPAYTNLTFSRQVLRGQALAALNDRNEEGFWLELLGGAKGVWQRPTVELGLAMNWERKGKLGQVFAKGSPITETMIRRQLILNAAAPDMLRSNAGDRTRPLYERDLAVFVLLYKSLSRGDYSAFGQDLALVRADANADSSMYYLPEQENVPVGLFAKGKWSDGYQCPSIGQTARALAANPQSVGARLCLGDFWRLNGFDQMNNGDMPRKSDELGGVGDLFPGRSLTRSAIYAAVIADPKAASPDKAYALYRAVMCYAPSGYNSCGGKGVAKAQRKGWYDQLKRDYPSSPWAKKLRYFW